VIDQTPVSVTSWLQIVLPLAIIALQAFKMWLDSTHNATAASTMSRIEVQTNGGWAQAHKEIADLKVEVKALKDTALVMAERRTEELLKEAKP
jgi:hypothetical protein